MYNNQINTDNGIYLALNTEDATSFMFKDDSPFVEVDSIFHLKDGRAIYIYEVGKNEDDKYVSLVE